jgi:flagellar basal-body rod modification protein FlgD
MDVSAIAGTTSKAASSAASLAENFDTFLTLLTTQLQYQDPLDPMDSNEFTQQLVQFTSVEQQIQGNKSLGQALSLLQANQTASAVAYIGRQVEANGDAAWLAAEDGATWGYELDAPASTATLTITDAAGKLVYAAPASLAAGHQEFVWDGKDAGGRRLPEGSYKFAVAAADKDGAGIAAAISVVGVVTAVKNKDGVPVLLLGRTEAPLSDVLHVKDASGSA